MPTMPLNLNLCERLERALVPLVNAQNINNPMNHKDRMRTLIRGCLMRRRDVESTREKQR